MVKNRVTRGVSGSEMLDEAVKFMVPMFRRLACLHSAMRRKSNHRQDKELARFGGRCNREMVRLSCAILGMPFDPLFLSKPPQGVIELSRQIKGRAITTVLSEHGVEVPPIELKEKE